MNEMATPTRTKRSALVESVNRDTPSTKTVATNEPKKAKIGTVSRPKNKPV